MALRDGNCLVRLARLAEVRRFQRPKRDRQLCPVCHRLIAVDRLGRYEGHGPGSWATHGASCDGRYRMAIPPSGRIKNLESRGRD